MAARRGVRLGVPLLVLMIAAALRLWHLGVPDRPVWDEQHYVFDANAYLGGGIGVPVGMPPPVRIADEGTWVHPPLGKWMMALLGVGPFGSTPFGWRFPSALFGVAGVGLLYLLALELWGSVWWAGMASLLLALDGLHIVQSRVGTLDIFLTTFVTAGLLFLVRDRNRMDAPPNDARRPIRLLGSSDRCWAGVMLGAAVATKWAGVFALAFAVMLYGAWILMGRERTRLSLRASAGTVVVSFVAVPVLVYLVAYGAFFFQHGPALHDFLTLQIRMWQYHQMHVQLQPENSAAWTWPLLLHPIRYWGLSEGSSVQRIVALGNPALWWGFLLLLPAAVLMVARSPRWQDAVAFGGYTAMFVPWLVVGRSQFLYYLLPAMPFMCLGLVAVLRRLPAERARTWGIAFLVLVAAAAVAFGPVWTGGWIPGWWADRLRLLAGWPI